VKILPYDGRAPEIFEEIKRFICSAIPFEVEVEHVGSTAVPGLGGKGIIDVLVVTRREFMDRVVEIWCLRGLGLILRVDLLWKGFSFQIRSTSAGRSCIFMFM